MSVTSDHVLLETQKVCVDFGQRRVLRDVDLQLSRGEFVTLLGPSGCGKSTLLNVASGLLSPAAGQAYFNGKRIDAINTSVGYMTQSDTLLPWRTVASNVALPLQMQRRLSRGEISSKVDNVLSLLELSDASHLFPAQLSGGMKRRALLARSMIYEPELLLMDEPFAALDAQLRSQMHRELLAAVARTGQAVMFVTHDIVEAAVLSDRVVVLGGGPPAGVTSIHEVPWGRERDLDELRFDPAVAAFERELHLALEQAKRRPHVALAPEGAQR